MEGFKWENRRKWVGRVLWFHMAVIAWLLTPYVSDQKSEALIMPLCLSFAAVIGSYIFGAAWEHTSIAKGKNDA